jgi:hypothetical protein
MTQLEPDSVELLQASLERKERELELVTAISRLIGQAHPLRYVLDQIAAHVAELLGTPFCAILLSHPDDGLLTIEGAYGLDAH